MPSSIQYHDFGVGSRRRMEEIVIGDEVIKDLRNRFIREVFPTDFEVIQDAERHMELKIINQVSTSLANDRIEYDEFADCLTGQV